MTTRTPSQALGLTPDAGRVIDQAPPVGNLTTGQVTHVPDQGVLLSPDTGRTIDQVPPTGGGGGSVTFGTTAGTAAAGNDARFASNLAAANAAAATAVGGIPDAAPALVLPGAIPSPNTLMVTTFAAGHGYSNNASGTVNLNDTTDFVLGIQSVSVQTDGAGTAKTIKKVAQAAVDATGLIPKLWVKVDANLHVAGLQIYLGDTNLANFFKWELKSATGGWLTDGRWHAITLTWGEAVATGTPNRAAITDVQFRIVDDAAATVTVHLGGLALVPEPTTWPMGVVSLTFDDTYASHYTQARRKMDQYGYRGTAFTILEYVGLNSTRMTMAQLHALEEYSGWDVTAHATTGAVHAARFTSLTPAQLDVEFSTLRNWSRVNGFRGDYVAYPGGEYNDDVLTATQKWFTAGRLVYQRPETLPPARVSKIRSGGYVAAQPLVATLTGFVDRAIANREWLVMTWHDILTTTVQSTDYSIANFESVIDYIRTAGIPVRTMGEVLRTMPLTAGINGGAPS